MAPAEIYAMTPKSVIKSFSELVLNECSHGHLQVFEEMGPGGNFDFEGYKYDYVELGNLQIEDPRIEVRVHEYERMDYKRYWKTVSVWLDGNPVMVAQNAGRYGDDWVEHWITDEGRYLQLCLYVREQILAHTKPTFKVTKPYVVADPDAADPKLVEYYGHKFGTPYYRY